MKTHVALLRGVNVGGSRKVAMADLRALVEAAGLGNPRTLLNSGNLVFQSDGKRDDRALEVLLEEQAAKRLGLTTWFVMRSAEEWTEVISRNPFPEEAAAMPSRFLALFFRETPGAEAMRSLLALKVDSGRLHLEGKQLYVVYPEGFLSSKMGSVLLSARFAKLATGRNWNTVLKLGALARA